jgi:isochorismate pyruvate lyase
MTNHRITPADCRTMAEVRQEVDRLDEEIVALLAERFRYMEAAARIKPDRNDVRDEARKAEVLANARRLSDTQGAPSDRIAEVYDLLVEQSIAHEMERFDVTRSG